MKTRKIVILFVLVFSLLFTGCLTKVPEKDLGISFRNATVAYDGEIHELTVSGRLPEGYEVKYYDNGQSEIGAHKVTAEVIEIETGKVCTVSLDSTKFHFFDKETEINICLRVPEESVLPCSVKDGNSYSFTGNEEWK